MVRILIISVIAAALAGVCITVVTKMLGIDTSSAGAIGGAVGGVIGAMIATQNIAKSNQNNTED